MSRAGDIKIPGVEHVAMHDEAANDLKSLIDVASKSKNAEGHDSIEILVQVRIDLKNKTLQRIYPFLRGGQLQTLRIKTDDGCPTIGEKMDADECKANRALFGGSSRYSGVMAMEDLPSEN
ncbi:MAG: hypothetical protein NC489_33780 [Ruminococcus flavefaciens]|nr:hypothetical protein [Ruminococcus flavefaciens]